jgi:hypothetical protein
MAPGPARNPQLDDPPPAFPFPFALDLDSEPSPGLASS